jgi:EAL domain-containing protein (putative c-di-GMP-specific phosphodiesterase class I)
MLDESITTLSHKMSCTVIAEGVETEEECATLRTMGIDYGQGYLFYRPQHPDILMKTLAGPQFDEHARVAQAS